MKSISALALFLLLASSVDAQVDIASAEFFPSSSLGKARLIGDVDLDGDPDGIWTTGQTITTFLNAGGTLTRGPSSTPGVPLQNGFLAFLPIPGIGDIDGDMLPDLVFGSKTGTNHSLQVVFGDGAGGFGSLESIPLPFAKVNGVLALELADFDLDGAQEIAVAVDTTTGFFTSDKRYDVLHYDWDGAQFVASPAVVVAPGRILASMEVADVDSNGTPDLVVSDILGPFVQFLPTVGGQPTLGSMLTISSTLQGSHVRAADFGDDGDEDLLLTRKLGSGFYLSVLEKIAPNQYDPVGIDSFITGTNGMGPQPHVGDWDNDGDLDVANQWDVNFFFENDGANRFLLATEALTRTTSSTETERASPTSTVTVRSTTSARGSSLWATGPFPSCPRRSTA